jgi:Transcription elongation factor, GreA/GreB, C-term
VSKLSGDTIKFGATVTLIDEDTGEKRVWQLVGEPEADASKGRISVTSPIARALIGKTKGTTVEVEAPGGAKVYKIRQVEWLEDTQGESVDPIGRPSVITASRQRRRGRGARVGEWQRLERVD